MAHSRGRTPDRHHAASLVFNLETCELDAILLDQILCDHPVRGVADLRTAATSAVATKHLAREDANTVGIIGSGRQAQSHLAALAEVRAIKFAKVYSRSPANRGSYARQMAGALKLDIEPVTTAEEAADGMDIVLVMTDASDPVLFGEWLSPGQHVTSVLGGNTPRDSQGRASRPPRRDLDDEAIRRSDVIVINSRAQAEQDLQGDIMIPVERGVVGWDHLHELSELVGGKVPGRTESRQITLYKNNGAQGVADVALATFAAKKARALGLGMEV
jgi:ornithine cyclodeaminase/alanine dehydrogenase-like protein (mu-crystallin family)